MSEKQPTDRLHRYCVVCGRTYGPALDGCCTAGSLVATSTKGFIRKQRVYFTLEGVPLSTTEVDRLRVELTNASLTKSTSSSGRLQYREPANVERATLENVQPPQSPLRYSNGRPENERQVAGSGDATYHVAISFAGADRAVAEVLARALQGVGVTVFYDGFDKDAVFGKNLGDYLADVYSKRCKFCLMLVSSAYVTGDWTRFERQVAQARAIRSKREFLLPVRLDDTELPGQAHSIAWRDLRRETVAEIVASIRAKVSSLAEELLPWSDGSESMLIELQSDLQPDPTDERRMHNVHDAVLQRAGLAETRLIGCEDVPHRMQLETTPAAYRKLRELVFSGALETVTGVRWTKVSPLDEVDRPPLPRQVPLAALQLEHRPPTLNAKQVVCHARQIRGFERESTDAYLHFGMVDRYTRDMTRLRAYITSQGNCIYIESNYVKPGFQYPTKIATEFQVDLLTLFVNLVFLRLPSQEELQTATLAHIHRAEYIVNREKLGPRGDDFYRGAMNVRFVADPI